MIPFSPRRSPTYTGDGVVVDFAFAFKVFTTADVAVLVSDLDGVETQLDLGADYSVLLNVDQSNFPGGTVTLLAPLTDEYKLVVIGALEYKQSTQLPNGGNYNASVVERALDSLSIQVQQLLERADRTLILAATAGDGVSTSLPAPAAISVIGWDAAGTGLRNYNPGDLGVAVSYANWQTQLFDGTGAQTAFVLDNDAGSASNIDLRVANVPQTPGFNFSYDPATQTITFLTGAPSVGTGNVVARYGQALPQGTFALADNSVAGSKLVDGAVTLIKTTGLASSGANSNITSLSGLTTPLSLAQGGLGAATAPAARANIEASRSIQLLVATVNASALTITLNPTNLEFRSTTLASGSVVTRTVASAISMVVSNGSTLGTSNGVISRLAVLAIDNAGTVELAVVNLLGGVNLDESGLISTTAEGGVGTADSASTVYSTTARSFLAYRIVGFIESTQATAGTWATAPSLVNGSGSPLAMWLAGYGKTSQGVTGSRALNTNYTNTTGRPIDVNVSAIGNASTDLYIQLLIDGSQRARSTVSYQEAGVWRFIYNTLSFTVHPGETYRVDTVGGSVTLTLWSERR